MEYKVGDKFKGTAEIIERHIGIDKDSILTISKIENDLIYLNCENYNYVWCIKDDFNKYFIPFKDDNIIEYQGKKYDVLYGCFSGNMADLLLKEHKEEILDDIEKEYLRNAIKYVIEPTKVKILNIIKDFSNGYYYITIRYYSKKLQIMNYVTLPAFTDKRMYKDMKLNKAYTLEELGL